MQQIRKAASSSTLLLTTQSIYLRVEENNVKLHKFSIRGLNLAAVKHTTVQVTRLPF
jgi:hypothetical protein